MTRDDQTFPKSEHLAKTKEFRKAYKEGVAFRRGALVIYKLRTGRERNRIGFVVAARLVKRANKRNRIKRLLREAYRTSKNQIKTGFDLIIAVKKDLGTGFTSAESKRLFLDLVKQAGLLE